VDTYKNKLVVLRGNSGSGKSTTARALRDRVTGKIAIIEQDYLRRSILREKEVDDGDNIGLIETVTLYALSKGYDVILEGILYFPRYGATLDRLRKVCPESYFYYFDISFDETLKRHSTKTNAHEFGENEMRNWYKAYDRTGYNNEKIVPESYTLEQTLDFILSDCSI
jgi:adenylate kinase family enzyme